MAINQQQKTHTIKIMNYTEIKPKCSNCGTPNNRGMFCPKCDSIIFVCLQFDEYIDESENRLGFLQSIEAAGVGNIPSLRAESVKRQKPLMQSLANRIDSLTRAFPSDIAAEIFRRALARSKSKAENMVRNTQIATDARNESYRAVAVAMSGVTEKKPKEPTPAQKVYDGFDHAGNEPMTGFFD
jgi:hypothetical protein